MESYFMGMIIQFAGNFAPRGWAMCDGQLLPISQYSALFSILGTTFGGDGRTTFGLPDLRGRTPIHAGNGPGLSTRKIGEKGGTETNTLTIAEMPAHNHSAAGKLEINSVATDTSSDPKSFAAPSYGVDSGGNAPINLYSTTQNAFGANDGVVVTVGNTGGGQSVNDMQPWISIGWVISLQGPFPSRS